MKTMKYVIITGILCGLLAVCCACGGTKPQGDQPLPTSSAQMPSEAEQTEANLPDPTMQNWVDAELDCYDYTAKNGLCYAKFTYPEMFQKTEQNDDGEQYRGYWYSDNNGPAAESKYGIYAYFLQGGYGAHQNTLEEGLVGGQFEERQLGGKTVLFGQMDDSQNPAASGYTYCYYVPYDEDDYARIWILVQDQEENGAFRQMFEQSLNFEK